MKVALVLDRFDPWGDGLERWTTGLARFLAARGHDVHAVAFEQAEHDVPVTVHVLPRVTGVLQRGRAVARVIERLRADVVHDTGTGWSGDVFHPQMGSRLLAQARLRATNPPLLRLRAAVSPVSLARRRQMAVIERRQVRRAHRIVAVSRLVRSQLAHQHHIDEQTLTVIHNGVDTSRFRHPLLARIRIAMRERLKMDTATVFAASAHDMRLKGVDTAIRALGVLTAEGEDVRLLVAGAPADAHWCSLAQSAGVGDRVIFLGPVPRIELVFAAADAMVHPTRWDACSLSTIEAGAAGLPVVTTAMNGASELIRDGETGFVVPDPEDLRALTARMRVLLDAELRQRIGDAARKAAVAHDTTRNLASVEQVLAAAATA